MKNRNNFHLTKKDLFQLIYKKIQFKNIINPN
jgi:hypothetical protein